MVDVHKNSVYLCLTVQQYNNINGHKQMDLICRYYLSSNTDTTFTGLYYMSNIVSVLWGAGTVSPSRALGFIFWFWWGLCCSSFKELFCLRLMSCMYNVASVFGLFILVFLFGFSLTFISQERLDDTKEIIN